MFGFSAQERLEKAVARGDAEAAKKALEAGASPNENEGRLLKNAAFAGRVNVARLLMQLALFA